MRASIRGARLEELFREELNSILNHEISDQRLESARVTRVELSRDGSRARVWYTLAETPERPHGGSAEHRRAFEGACRFLRARLTEALPLERTPSLQFFWDPAVHAGEGPNTTESS